MRYPIYTSTTAAYLSFIILVPALASSFSIIARPQRIDAVGRDKMLMKPAVLRNTARHSTQTEWVPLDPESLVAAPCLIEQTLCVADESVHQPRRAKDFHYAKAVLDAWKQQELDEGDSVWSAETCRVQYAATYGSDSERDPNPGKQPSLLHGHLIRKGSSGALGTQSSTPRPGILFFHTGAGPQDLFLFWKAVALVQKLDCVVLIADILGDETGWAWDADRSRYQQAREHVLAQKNTDDPNDDESRSRPELRARIRAALDVLGKQDEIDTDRLGAMGWCLGGYPILELGQMNLPSVKAMATFHGVFGEDERAHGSNLPSPEGSASGEGTADIIICHGVEDPFVSNQSLEYALETLQAHRHRTSLLQLSAKHGYTNPAQDFNDSDAFAYNAEAANKAWNQAVNLFVRTVGG